MALDPEIEALLDGAPLSAHLATSVDDRPHVAPIWYGYREGVLYALTGGTKLANVRRNPRVAVSIEQSDGRGGVEWGVTLLGRTEVVEDADRISTAESWIFEAYDGHDADGDLDDADGDLDDADGDADDADDAGDADDLDVGEAGVDYALLEITIGSATLQRYD